MKLIVVLFVVVVAADSNLDSQVFKGQEAKDGDYPYHVAIHIAFNISISSYNCGGSLISETFILTAAHCIDKYEVKHIKAFLGSRYHDEGTERPALNKIVHPKWNWTKAEGNDIGLLEIDPISYSDTIKSIDLPLFSDSNLDYETHIAVLSGWGWTNSSNSPQILQYTYLMVVSNAACSKANAANISKEIICAADPDESAACRGDSGGPLVDMDTKRLIGIVSFGPYMDCKSIHFGTAFTRVASFRQWIFDNTGI